jgi:hypothetical protein
LDTQSLEIKIASRSKLMAEQKQSLKQAKLDWL